MPPANTGIKCAILGNDHRQLVHQDQPTSAPLCHDSLENTFKIKSHIERDASWQFIHMKNNLSDLNIFQIRLKKFDSFMVYKSLDIELNLFIQPIQKAFGKKKAHPKMGGIICVALFKKDSALNETKSKGIPLSRVPPFLKYRQLWSRLLTLSRYIIGPLNRIQCIFCRCNICLVWYSVLQAIAISFEFIHILYINNECIPFSSSSYSFVYYITGHYLLIYTFSVPWIGTAPA